MKIWVSDGFNLFSSVSLQQFWNPTFQCLCVCAQVTCTFLFRSLRTFWAIEKADPRGQGGLCISASWTSRAEWDPQRSNTSQSSHRVAFLSLAFWWLVNGGMRSAWGEKQIYRDSLLSRERFKGGDHLYKLSSCLDTGPCSVFSVIVAVG